MKESDVRRDGHMVGEKVNFEDLKKSGYTLQRDAEPFTVKMQVPGGDLSSEQMVAVAEIAEKLGRGKVDLTTRQGVQITWIKFEKLGLVTNALDKVKTSPGSCGPRVRNIVSCMGLPRCPQANIDSQEFARAQCVNFLLSRLPVISK